jgi:radical SAM protein with 4Fe4S-binding SPASM domain
MKMQQNPIPTGVHHFLVEQNGGKARVHLRVEPDGNGLLLVNANRAFHLNQTGTFIAYLQLQQKSPTDITKAIQSRFRVKQKQAAVDFAQFSAQFKELISPSDACPIHDLGVETIPPFSQIPSAPYRMDLALTYRCNNACTHCYNLPNRVKVELTTAEWEHVLDILWDEGIPHIVFTGGEPTLRDDLPELAAHAEKLGQISGINTNGRRLKDAGLVKSLSDAGLDHVQITFESAEPLIHDQMVNHAGAWKETVEGLRNVLASRMFVMTNTTLLKTNAPRLSETLDFLAELGVPTIGLNALIHSGRGAKVSTGLTEAELQPLLDLAVEKTSKHKQRLIWYTPTQYCHFDPVQMQLGVKGCSAAKYNMCVEPDGSVIPCQSYYSSLGNILDKEWAQIWNHDLAVSLREHKNVPIKCLPCPLFTECGGGCPLSAKVQTPEPMLIHSPLEE